MRTLVTAALCLLLAGCSGTPPKAHDNRSGTSLLGQPLLPEAMPADRLAKLEADLESARAALAQDPGDEARIIWLGRRQAYLGRYRDAIDTFTRGLKVHPHSHRLLRHRGHRYITLRQFDLALVDLQRSAALAKTQPDAIEPDGAPNDRNLPRSTDHSNIYYHLGLVHYLRAEYEEAERAFAARESLTNYNDDMLVSTTHWRYLALRRLGRDADAAALLRPIRAEMDVIENQSYHRLCLMYKGELNPEALAPPEGKLPDAGTAYGVVAYLQLQGHAAEANKLRERLLADTSWAAFGHIAAEADLARDRAAARNTN